MFTTIKKIISNTNTSITHGSARWANEQEIKQLAKSAGIPLSLGALNLAPFKGGYLELPRRVVTRHVCVFGASGSGKSRGLIMPGLE